VDLKTKGAHELFTEMSRTEVPKRFALMRELVSRSSLAAPILIARWNTCGSPIRGRTATGRERKGLQHRCGLTCCHRCQNRAGIAAGKRTWSLMSAAQNEMPDRNLMSAITIDADDRNLHGFARRLKLFMRRHGLNYSGEFSVSLPGLMRVHVVVLHPTLTRLALTGLLKEQFGPYPIVNVKVPDKTKTLEQAVRGWVQYAHVPVKNKDFIHHPELRTQDGLAGFVMLDTRVVEERRLEGGFSLDDKAKAARIRKIQKSKYGESDRVRALAIRKRILENTMTRQSRCLGKDSVKEVRQLGSGGEVGPGTISNGPGGDPYAPHQGGMLGLRG